jgi:hypothetical protein
MRGLNHAYLERLCRAGLVPATRVAQGARTCARYEVRLVDLDDCLSRVATLRRARQALTVASFATSPTPSAA